MREQTRQAIVDELRRARLKFPGHMHMLPALMEEVGELARAYLEGEGEQRVFDEAVQVASTAIRIAEEGDGSFEQPTSSHPVQQGQVLAPSIDHVMKTLANACIDIDCQAANRSLWGAFTSGPDGSQLIGSWCNGFLDAAMNAYSLLSSGKE